MAILPSIKFVFDRKHTAGRDSLGNIDLRITYNRKQKFVVTGAKCFLSQWNDKKQCVVNSLDSLTLNEILSKLHAKVLQIINSMSEKGNIDIDAIPALLKNKSTDKTFHQYIRERISKRNVSENTKKAYHVFLSRYLSWGGMKFFSDISEKSIREFDEYLHSFTWTEHDRFGNEVIRKYSQATIGSMHKNLKAFINDAIVDGILTENPYSTKRIKIDKGETRIDHFLTENEVKRIETSKMPTKSLSETRDLFLIQIYTGLSYCDLMIFDFTKCKDAEDFAVFSGFRKKTGVMFTFVLTPKAKSILKKYKYKLPKMPNQKYNVKLKILADAAGIDESITTHDGRRSCGYILLNAGVPWSVVTRVLGHSSVKQTEKAYAKLLDETIVREYKDRIK